MFKSFVVKTNREQGGMMSLCATKGWRWLLVKKSHWLVDYAIHHDDDGWWGSRQFKSLIMISYESWLKMTSYKTGIVHHAKRALQARTKYQVPYLVLDYSDKLILSFLHRVRVKYMRFEGLSSYCFPPPAIMHNRTLVIFPLVESINCTR